MLSNDYLSRYLAKYLEDAQTLVSLASQHIDDSMTPEEAIKSMLLFASGVEKLLKYALAEINPIFILKKADFKHSAPSLYGDSILSANRNDESKADVIDFRVALGRSKAFYKTAHKYSQMLFTFGKWNDIIAHRSTAELNLDKVARLLQKDALPLIKDFAEELKLPLSSFFGSEKERLTELSRQLTNPERFARDMKMLFESHRSYWEHLQTQAERLSQAHDNTAALLKRTTTDHAYTKVTCPVCGNVATVRTEPDYDHADGEQYQVGVYADRLLCNCCNIILDTYESLNFIDVYGLLRSNEP
jgi:hypothetical protein